MVAPSTGRISPRQRLFPPAARGWYAVAVFYSAYTLAFVDRQIMTFLVGPIRADFQLTDFEFSLLQGLGFVIFYSLLGIPIARLADVHNRRNIIAAGIALWSVMTALCGLAGSFRQLFLARLGVGVGESALSPAAISIIADAFPPEKRALPISVYSAGVHGGAGLANIGGGLVVGYAMAGGGRGIPLLSDLRPWQMALMLVGLPGLLVSVWSLTVREPARRERDTAGHPSFGEVLRYLGAHRVLYGSLMVGAALAALANYGAFSWVPALFTRRFGWSPRQIGLTFGPVTLVCGTAGLLAAGAVASKMAAAGRTAPYTRIMGVSMAAGTIPAALLVAVDDPYWTLVCLGMMVFFMSTPIGLAQTALQAVSPNQMRAQVIALYLLTTALIGNACGPSAVAAMTDYYYRNDAAVGSSIAVVSALAAMASAVIILLGASAYERKTQSPEANL